MKFSFAAYLLAFGVSAAALQANEPFPIKFIAMGHAAQAADSEHAALPRSTGVPHEVVIDQDFSHHHGAEASDLRAIRVPARYGEMSGLLMHRVGAGFDRVVVLDDGGILGADTPAISTGDFDSSLTGGFQTMIGWHLFGSAHSAVEFGFYGLYGWDADATATSTGTLLGAGLATSGLAGLGGANFAAASSVDLSYASDLYNFEANYVRSFYAMGAKIDFLTGFRYVHLDESLGIVSDNTITVPIFGEVAPGVGTYDVSARNNLFGHQIGGRFTRPFGNWSVQTVGKAGVFINDASTSQRLSDASLLGGATELFARDDDRSVAALGEIGIFGRRQLTDTWALRVGYQATGIGGVALAADQQTLTTSAFGSEADVRSDAFFFMHGGVFGLEASW